MSSEFLQKRGLSKWRIKAKLPDTVMQNGIASLFLTGRIGEKIPEILADGICLYKNKMTATANHKMQRMAYGHALILSFEEKLMNTRKTIKNGHENYVVSQFITWYNKRYRSNYTIVDKPDPPDAIARSNRRTLWLVLLCHIVG